MFKQTFPDEEFLPRAPDPEEIVIEDAEEATTVEIVASNEQVEPAEEKIEPESANATCAEENATTAEEEVSTPSAECEEVSETLQKEE